MERLLYLATKYRSAIEIAFAKNRFTDDIVFKCFPNGCCGDTCYLLAMYLHNNMIITSYICGTMMVDEATHLHQTHAWLVTEDEIIVDITGDQFKDSDHYLNYNLPVYVGQVDEFHKQFIPDRSSCYTNTNHWSPYDMLTPRLKCLYEIINGYLGQ